MLSMQGSISNKHGFDFKVMFIGIENLVYNNDNNTTGFIQASLSKIQGLSKDF